jgi:hypothetical protein
MTWSIYMVLLFLIGIKNVMRSSLVVRASDCQCTSCNGPGFDPSIRRHSGIWGAADEAVLNIVWTKRKKIPPKKCYVYCPSNTFNHVRLLEIHLSCFTYWILVILSIKIYVLNLKKHPPGWRICIALCISCMHFNFFKFFKNIRGKICSKDSLFLLLKFEKNLKSSHSKRLPWKKRERWTAVWTSSPGALKWTL